MQNKIIRKVRLLGDTLSVALLNQAEWLSNRLHDYANRQRPALTARNGAVTIAGATAQSLSENAPGPGKYNKYNRSALKRKKSETTAFTNTASARKFGANKLEETSDMKNVVHYESYLKTDAAATAEAFDANTPQSAPKAGREERRQQQDRRNYSTKTMWLCLTSPRRAHGRRRSDRRFPVQDVFGEGAMILAAVLMVLSLTDAFLTLNILARGGSEVNPVMNYMLGFGTFAFVATKMVMTAIPVAALTAAGNVKVFNFIRVRTLTAVLVGMYCALIVYELILLSL